MNTQVYSHAFDFIVKVSRMLLLWQRRGDMWSSHACLANRRLPVISRCQKSFFFLLVANGTVASGGRLKLLLGWHLNFVLPSGFGKSLATMVSPAEVRILFLWHGGIVGELLVVSGLSRWHAGLRLLQIAVVNSYVPCVFEAIGS